MSKRVNIQDVRPNLSSLLREVAGQNEQVIIARYGRPIGALVSMTDLKRIWDDWEDEHYGPAIPNTPNSRPGGWPHTRPDILPFWCKTEGWAPLYRKRKAAERDARREARTKGKAERGKKGWW